MAIRAIPADTSPEAFRVMVEAYRAMPASRRLEIAVQMSDNILEFAAAGVRQRHPEFTDEQVRRTLVLRQRGDRFSAARPRTGHSSMDQQVFFDAIVSSLDDLKIPFMVAGSHGSSHYGMPRTTNNIDLVIAPTGERLESLCARIGDRYYVSAPAAYEALRTRFMFNVLDVSGGWKADFIIRKNRPFSLEEFSRRRVSSLFGRTVWVASPEDIILSKLEWNKLTPSERQVQDALDVAIVQWPHLDQGYLRQWANELEVSDSLEAVLLHAAQANQVQ